jgi:hypothetical protein
MFLLAILSHPRHGWEDIQKWTLKKGWKDMDWNYLAKDMDKADRTKR